jgi:glycosyltransferase involved in cell wall biosynthesis
MAAETRSTSLRPFRIGVWVSASQGGSARSLPPDHLGINGLGGLLEGLLEAGPEDTVHVVLPPGDRDALGPVAGRSPRLGFDRPDRPHGLGDCLLAVRKRLDAVLTAARRLVGLIESFATRLEMGLITRLRTRGRLLLLGLPFLSVAALIFLVFYAAWQVAAAVLRTLDLPAPVMAWALRKLSWRWRFQALRSIVDRAECDVWLVPSLQSDFPFSPDVRCVLVVDGSPGHPAPKEAVGSIVRRAWTLVGYPHSRSTLYLVQTHAPHANPILPALEGGPDRARVVLPCRTWLEAGREWRKVLAEAALLPLPGSGLAGLFPPSPSHSHRRYRVRLFLPQVYLGGVWEALRILLAGLVEVNRRRQSFDLTLALPTSQPCVEQVESLDGLSVEWLTRQVFTREEAQPLLGALRGPAPEGDLLLLPWSPSATDADAWFALVDRLSPAVLPMRPLAVLVHDVIQRHVPEVFPPSLFVRFFPEIRASARAADRVMTTNPATRLDVIEEFGLDPACVRLVPVACEPHARFIGLAPQAVPVPDGFVLNITNISPHKGAELVLRAHALLKKARGEEAPPLVICGVDTDKISPSRPTPDHPSARHLRALVGQLGLCEGRDVWFLGYLRDEQLLDLFQRCSVVVNAARYDNGTYSLIEGHYFGKPTVCTRYPAAEALYERFEVPVRYFEMGNAEDLAEKIGQAVREPMLVGDNLNRVRERLADPRHGGLRYAEEVYDLLLELCRQGGRTPRESPVAAR